VAWQLAQLVSVVMCVVPLPVAFAPLWQLKQLPVIPEWSKPVAGFQAVGLWQFPQALSLAMWLTGLPVATEPL
jgi:hypothetical protein